MTGHIGERLLRHAKKAPSRLTISPVVQSLQRPFKVGPWRRCPLGRKIFTNEFAAAGDSTPGSSNGTVLCFFRVGAGRRSPNVAPSCPRAAAWEVNIHKLSRPAVRMEIKDDGRFLSASSKRGPARQYRQTASGTARHEGEARPKWSAALFVSRSRAGQGHAPVLVEDSVRPCPQGRAWKKNPVKQTTLERLMKTNPLVLLAERTT